jgi:hypothetical protein
MLGRPISTLPFLNNIPQAYQTTFPLSYLMSNIMCLDQRFKYSVSKKKSTQSATEQKKSTQSAVARSYRLD